MTDERTLDAVFAPVQSQTAFEETLERLGSAIRLGLLEPGSQLPPERELCERLGIARSTLRQALTALAQSGYLHALRGRGGGTFVVERPPLAEKPSEQRLADWRDACAMRLATELGVAALAAERAQPGDLPPLRELVDTMDRLIGGDFAAYRRHDVRLHVGLAELTGAPRLVAAATEVQGEMTDLIAHIPHPPEVLAWANQQHAALLDAVGRHDAREAVRIMQEHLGGPSGCWRGCCRK